MPFIAPKLNFPLVSKTHFVSPSKERSSGKESPRIARDGRRPGKKQKQSSSELRLKGGVGWQPHSADEKGEWGDLASLGQLTLLPSGLFLASFLLEAG